MTTTPNPQDDGGPETLVPMPETMATASFTDAGDILVTGVYDRPLRALEAKQRTTRHRASIDLISTEQAEEYACRRVQEALEAAADAIASNAQACEDAITRLVLDSNERALRGMVPLLRARQENTNG